jgi:citrate synthase
MQIKIDQYQYRRHFHQASRNGDMAMTLHEPPRTGLDGIVAATTALSHVDGEAGELVIAGRRVADLAANASFEATAARLWSLASASEVSEAEARGLLGAARLAAFERLRPLLAALRGLSVVEAVRAAIAAVPTRGATRPEATLAGAMATIVAAVARQERGLAPIVPDPESGHAADLLRMLRGTSGSDAEARALEAYLVTVSDHGMNASTFACRVVASTGADIGMAVTAAYCALSGPLHGGAPEPVLDMLDEIGGRDNVAPWIDDALARGERLMGFGHRIYKVRDPRADVLKAAIETLGEGRDLGLASDVEAHARAALAKAKPGRRLDTNVEFYTAILLDALDIPRASFTPVFAAGRVLGWTAHAIEQRRTGRLMRPASIYSGAMPT